MKYYLAIDIGASSGRHVVGWLEDGKIETKEVYRFENGVVRSEGHLVWDVDALISSVICGIRAAFEQYPRIESLSVDTWGVDYVLLDGEEIIYPVYAYRDSRGESAQDAVHALVPFSELYRRTGCQNQPFNTIYQLYDDKISGRLSRATELLMLPEYIMKRLCGISAREYTNATTTGLVSARSGEYDMEIIRALGYPERLFPTLSHPGTVLGNLLPEVSEAVGGDCAVVLCATHDTGSAVEGIPMSSDGLYISSGTWSLLGVKTERPLTDAESERSNYSNEGGVGYNRYQKNIMGMWLINELRRELCPHASFDEIVEMSRNCSCEDVIDANSSELLSPRSMRAAFDALTGGRLLTSGDYFRCTYSSLAHSYAEAIEELERAVGRKYSEIYIVGGGAKNDFLNSLTEQATGKRVIALPIEASALGNIKIQAEAMK